MANYISTLTGPQMDAALLDMAEHNSEAWAVGTRDGEAVTSADVTYHNNAAYYADQANGAAARAEAAVPAGTEGALLFTQSQALSDTQKRTAQANIGVVAGPRRNMCDNGWFQVNQRGTTSTSVSGSHIVDRWKVIQNMSATVESDGSITLQPTASGNTYFVQDFPRGTMVVGEVYTISLLVNGTIYSRSISMRTSAAYSAFQPSLTNVTLSIYQTSLNGVALDRLSIRLTGGTTTTLNITAVKLEKGYMSTLALDALPNYTEELLRCKRYLHVIKTRSGIAQLGIGVRWNSSGQYRVFVQLPVDMFEGKAPTAAVSNIANLLGYYQSSTGSASTSLSVPNSATYDKVMLLITCAGLSSAAAVATFGLANGEQLIISAEL